MRSLRYIPVLLLVAGCAGSETGNGAREEVPVQVEMKLVAGPAGSYVVPDRSGAEFEITGGATLVDRLDFILSDDDDACDDDDDDEAPTVGAYEVFCVGDSGRLRVEGPWSIDLLTGEATPSLDELLLPTGAIVRIEARLVPGNSRDWTLAVDGAFGARDFRLELRFNDVVAFAPAATVDIDSALARLTLALDPSTWFAELDLADCIAAGAVPADDDGVLRLDQGSSSACGNVENRVEKALRDGARVDEGHE